MGLRTNAMLKIFVIVLFSFEMIAPALCSAFTDQNDTSITTTLLGEETSEECKDYKSTPDLIDLDFSRTYSLLAITERNQFPRVELNSAASQPPLFTLFHTFLI